MLSQKETIRLAISKYGELWGEETVDKWVEKHTIGDCYSAGNPEIFSYTVDQDDSFNDPNDRSIFNPDGSVTVDESSLPTHRTTFEINRRTGELQIVEHW